MEVLTDRIVRMPTWLRWPLLLPASAVTYLVVHLGVVLGGKILVFFQHQQGWGDNFFQYLLAPLLAGYFSITFPASLAPTRPRRVGFVLCCIWMVVYGVLAGLAIFTGGFKTLFPILVSALTAGAGLITLEDEHPDIPKIPTDHLPQDPSRT